MSLKYVDDRPFATVKKLFAWQKKNCVKCKKARFFAENSDRFINHYCKIQHDLEAQQLGLCKLSTLVTSAIAGGKCSKLKPLKKIKKFELRPRTEDDFKMLKSEPINKNRLIRELEYKLDDILFRLERADSEEFQRLLKKRDLISIEIRRLENPILSVSQGDGQRNLLNYAKFGI